MEWHGKEHKGAIINVCSDEQLIRISWSHQLIGLRSADGQAAVDVFLDPVSDFPLSHPWQLVVQLTCSQCGTRLFSAVSRCLHDSCCAQNHLSNPADPVASRPHTAEKTPRIFGIKLFVMEGVFCLFLSVLFCPQKVSKWPNLLKVAATCNYGGTWELPEAPRRTWRNVEIMLMNVRKLKQNKRFWEFRMHLKLLYLIWSLNDRL